MERKQPTRLADGVRAAVEDAGKAGASQYRICAAAGIAQPILSRFMAGERGMEWATAERLAAVLGLRVTFDPKAARRLAKDARPPGRPPVKRRGRSK